MIDNNQFVSSYLPSQGSTPGLSSPQDSSDSTLSSLQPQGRFDQFKARLRKLNVKTVIGLAVLVLTVVGFASGLLLMNISQDTRQQASGDLYDQSCMDLCLKSNSGDSTACRNMCTGGSNTVSPKDCGQAGMAPCKGPNGQVTCGTGLVSNSAGTDCVAAADPAAKGANENNLCGAPGQPVCVLSGSTVGCDLEGTIPISDGAGGRICVYKDGAISTCGAAGEPRCTNVTGGSSFCKSGFSYNSAANACVSASSTVDTDKNVKDSLDCGAAGQKPCTDIVKDGTPTCDPGFKIVNPGPNASCQTDTTATGGGSAPCGTAGARPCVNVTGGAPTCGVGTVINSQGTECVASSTSGAQCGTVGARPCPDTTGGPPTCGPGTTLINPGPNASCATLTSCPAGQTLNSAKTACITVGGGSNVAGCGAMGGASCVLPQGGNYCQSGAVLSADGKTCTSAATGDCGVLGKKPCSTSNVAGVNTTSCISTYVIGADGTCVRPTITTSCGGPNEKPCSNVTGGGVFCKTGSELNSAGTACISSGCGDSGEKACYNVTGGPALCNAGSVLNSAGTACVTGSAACGTVGARPCYSVTGGNGICSSGLQLVNVGTSNPTCASSTACGGPGEKPCSDTTGRQVCDVGMRLINTETSNPTCQTVITASGGSSSWINTSLITCANASNVPVGSTNVTCTVTQAGSCQGMTMTGFYSPTGLDSRNTVQTNPVHYGTVAPGSSVNFSQYTNATCGAYQFDFNAPGTADNQGGCGAITFNMGPCTGGTPTAAQPAVTTPSTTVADNSTPGTPTTPTNPPTGGGGSPAPSTSPTPSPAYSCGSTCTSTAQCQTGNTAYACYNGTCRLNSNPNSTSCQPPTGASPSPSPAYACNTTCSTDSQCQSANSNYTCSSEHGNRCRLDSNRASETCQPAPQTYACNSTCSTDAQCQTVSSSYVCSNSRCRLAINTTAENCLPQTIVYPSPTVGCNATCSSNADCSNSGHVCLTTANGSGRCRAANYPNSESCSAPVITYTQQSQAAQGVAQAPQELPKTGPQDWMKWIGAGIATLGLGAVLLLLL